MKRKGVRVMVGVVLVCLLIGILGVYSASGSTKIGLTYRLNDGGGVKIDTQYGFGGELLFDYADYIYEDSKDTYLSFQPSLLYRFEGSSDTSLYVGIGYLSSTNTYENWFSGLYRESGIRLLVGMEHFLSEKFSFDLRVTACFNTWNDTWGSWEDQGTDTTIYVDMGVSIYHIVRSPQDAERQPSS